MMTFLTKISKEFLIVPKIDSKTIYYLFRDYTEIEFEITELKQIRVKQELYPEEVEFIRNNIIP